MTKVDAKDLKLDVTTGKAVISGLTPGTTYYFRTTCDDGTTYSIPVMQATESVIQLPDFTQGWVRQSLVELLIKEESILMVLLELINLIQQI